MKLGQFRYKLPEELIAQHPAKHRDESRLMVVHKRSGKIEHKMFKDVLDYFEEGDVMVNNNTRVFPARMQGNKEKTGSMIEEFKALVYKLGETPIPKYINRPVQPEDEEWFQTIFAKHEGAVAAPTAGLHFSRELLKRAEIKGVHMPEITMHIGLGTFRQVEVEDLTKHKMESEQCIIPDETAKVVNHALQTGHRVCAVGNTVLRAFESSVSTDRLLKPYDGWISKFIYPPYEFNIADSLITNFHQPESALLMCVTAYGGYDLIMEAYNEAVKQKYRFWAYGDAMLILT